ncbi:dextranase, partial [Salmonella enterica subsp. enterica serovar Typhimurium]
MPGGFVATGTEATDITVFNHGFGLLSGGIVGMQDATVPGRLPVQLAVN